MFRVDAVPVVVHGQALEDGLEQVEDVERGIENHEGPDLQQRVSTERFFQRTGWYTQRSGGISRLQHVGGTLRNRS